MQTVTRESESITTCEHKNNPTEVGGRERGDPSMSGKEQTEDRKNFIHPLYLIKLFPMGV